MYDTEHLEQLATAANDNLRSTWQLYGWPTDSVPELTPGMVLAVIEAAKQHGVSPADQSESKKWAAFNEEVAESIVAGMDAVNCWTTSAPPEPEPVAVAPKQVASAKRPAQPATPRPKPAKRPGRTSKIDVDAALADIKRVGEANGGTMPTLAEYDRLRAAGMPTGGAVAYRLGCKWSELAPRVGLRLSDIQQRTATGIAKAQADDPEPEPQTKPVDDPEPAPEPAPQPQAVDEPEPEPEPDETPVVYPPRNADERRRLYDEITLHLRLMADDNVLPTADEWDAAKPANLPTAYQITITYMLDDWRDFADRLGMQKPDLRKKRKALAADATFHANGR